MKRIRMRTLVVQIVCVAIAVVLGLFVVAKRGEIDEAQAAPTWQWPPPKPAVEAGAPEAAAPVQAGGPSTTPLGIQLDGGSDAPEPTPIDLAAAPDGGVPTHPGNPTYRSPFASPTPVAPVRVKVAMLLNSVDEYDVKTATFTADFFISFTSNVPMPAMNIQFPNGKVDDKETLADKPTFKLLRIRGSFKSPPDLRKYPFDAQELKILVEDDQHGIDTLRFSVDKERTQLARGFRALGWQVNYVEARSISHSYPDRFEGDDLYYGRYVFTLGLERYATSAAFKVFVPAFVIVIISLLGMWVPPNEMEVRSNAGAPMLAGAVLFHFALMQELPATSYLTRADKLMMGVYICLLLGMLSTWFMFLVKEERMELVFRVARWVVPPLSGVVMVLACLV
jgi:hypothetical protein